jgi:putative ribosome biogenesis GTPase RsgA
LRLEEDDRVNRKASHRGVAVGDEVAHKAKVKGTVEVTVEVVRRHEIVSRQTVDGVEHALLHAQHRAPPLSMERPYRTAKLTPFFNRLTR